VPKRRSLNASIFAQNLANQKSIWPSVTLNNLNFKKAIDELNQLIESNTTDALTDA